MATLSRRPVFAGLIGTVIVLTLLAVVLLSLAFALDDHPRTWVELLRYVPYPIWLAPTLIVWLLSWCLGWRWRLLASVAPLGVLTLVMGAVWGTPDSGSNLFRLMTYNIKSYKAESRPDGYQRLAWEIASHDPDVLVMQDAQFLTEPGEPLPPPMLPALKGRRIVRFDQYIIASRLPLRDCAPHTLPPRAYSLVYLRCIVTVKGRDIDLVTAHFLSPREGLNATRHERLAGVSEWQQNLATRLAQSTALVEDLAARSAKAPRLPRPVIVAGDLNAPESSPVIGRLLATGLRDAFSSAGQGWGYTHGHSLRPGLSFLRIDHILVSPELGVREAFVGGKDASEHRPVIADLYTQRD